MGEKNKKKNNGGQQENGGVGKNNATVVLKADLHCEGCVSKVLKCIRSFDGVDNASIGDGMRITVMGKVDPVKLREKLEKKTHKKVELVSPQTKKVDDNKNEGNNDNAKGKENNGSENIANQDKKKEDKNSQKNNSDEKKFKEKETPVATAVLKVHLHCEGCIQKIYKLVTKTKGYLDMKIDKQKELVTVTGAMDMKKLVLVLKKHLKKEVEIIPPKKEVEKKDNEGKEKGKSGGEKGKSGNNKGESGVKSGNSKAESGGKGGGNGSEVAGDGEKMEGNRMQFQVGYPYPFTYEAGVVEQFQYNMYASGPYHAPQMFSDENPNACNIM